MSTQHAQLSGGSGSAANAEGPAQMEKFATRRSLIVDAFLAAAFFAFMFSVISPHVQTENPVFVAIWGGGAAACLTGVFWLAAQMFRVVLRAQLAARRGR